MGTIGGNYAGRGNIYSADGPSPTLTAHLAKNRDEGLVVL